MGRMMIEDSGGYARDADALARTKASHKKVASAEGSGEILNYPDTNEEIVRDQKSGDGRIRSKPMKPGYRY